mgnify:CR=1 FL=1
MNYALFFFGGQSSSTGHEFYAEGAREVLRLLDSTCQLLSCRGSVRDAEGRDVSESTLRLLAAEEDAVERRGVSQDRR